MGHAMQNDRRRQPEGRNRQDGHDIEPGSGARAPREARASRGRRPAGDLTKSLGWGDPDALEVTLANHLSAVIEGEGIESREGILSHKEGIDLMPANIELAGMEMPILMAMSREQLMNVWLAPLKADYDSSSSTARRLG